MTLRYARVPDGLCLLCNHYGNNADRDTGFICDAFPDGIPREIVDARFDHRNPYPKDNGIQFEPKEGYQIPDWLEEHYKQEGQYPLRYQGELGESDPNENEIDTDNN